MDKSIKFDITADKISGEIVGYSCPDARDIFKYMAEVKPEKKFVIREDSPCLETGG